MMTSEVAMKITFRDREEALRMRLRERLERAAALRCTTHGEAVTAVTIHGLQNGWFDSQWTTCCEVLEQQAVAIVKARC
jgi:hypothetical protein